MRVGHPPGPPAWAAISVRWARGAMSCLVRWGSTTAAASVPATTTVWCSRAETVWAAQVACRLHPRALSLASVLVLPARFSSAGVDQVGDGPPRWRRAPGHGPRVGRGLGERLAPDPALGLVDLARQVNQTANRIRGQSFTQDPAQPSRPW